MYLVGAAHPAKEVARRLLAVNIAAGVRLMTDAEVFQEILHRYVGIGRRDAIEPAFEALASIVDVVYAIERSDVGRAPSARDDHPPVGARCAARGRDAAV
jgi:uncharacterized protein